jgi:hypothetical protein
VRRHLADGPAIQSFSAAATTHFIGDRARLAATFKGATGRVEPGTGVVTRGGPFDTPVLDSTRRCTVVVESPGQLAVRGQLTRPVRFRDRNQTPPTPCSVQHHVAATLGAGSVLVIGGTGGGSTASEAVDRCDPAAACGGDGQAVRPLPHAGAQRAAARRSDPAH